ncbi:unnamed protein product (mitochondrion) [Plasmodiophora brassicae]|uniref:Major facilitator superfamily (MFS) profile domain-containing protein n=1 Tax=Plasmodiophora brassicae TaxID=37360 RepID=A0A3P3Y6G8_PLABS|nr:unnamed protein product [Plasmodiophora brassicae]
MATSAGEVDETRRLFDSGPEYASLLQRPTARQLSPGSRRRHDPLSTWQAIAYALPSLAVAAQYLPTHIHVFKFYTDTLMVPAGSLAVGTAVARAMDCLIDPIVGWISDNTESSWGRRKPYILASLPFNAIAYYLLFTPSSTLAGHAATQWFTFFFFLFLAVPLSLPYYSLGPELTSDNAGRVRLFVYAEVWDKVGIIFAAILPSLLIVAFHGDIRRAYSDAALIIGGLTILTFSTLLIFVEEPQRPREILRNVKSSQFVPGIRRAMRNAPYRLLMYAATIGTLSHAVTNVIVTYYVACVIRVDGPEEFLGTVLCTFFIPAALSIPVWHFLARITDTRRAWLIGWASHVPICAAAFTLAS